MEKHVGELKTHLLRSFDEMSGFSNLVFDTVSAVFGGWDGKETCGTAAGICISEEAFCLTDCIFGDLPFTQEHFKPGNNIRVNNFQNKAESFNSWKTSRLEAFVPIK